MDNQLETIVDNTPATDVAIANEFAGQLEPGNRKAYALAGRATFTVRNPDTGNRFTFRVSAPKPALEAMNRADVYFVSVLTGENNTADYSYLGTLFPNGFRVTKKSRMSADAPCARAFSWLVEHWESGRVEVWHPGKCGKCGRALTVPESIATGLGPVCAEGGR